MQSIRLYIEETEICWCLLEKLWGFYSMEFQRKGNVIIARLDQGDKIKESIHAISVAENIKAGTVTGLGAIKDPEISFYHLDKQEYATKVFHEDFEVLSLNGTLAFVDNAPQQHIHLVLGKDDFTTIGGHLEDAEVSVTLELCITVLEHNLTRELDENVGLPTIKFE